MPDAGAGTVDVGAVGRPHDEECVGPTISFTDAIEPVDRRWPNQEDSATIVSDALPMSNRIGLLAHFGTGNLGDDATIAAGLQLIRSRRPEAYLVGLSMDPEDSERRHGIPCFPMRQKVFAFEREWSTELRPADPGRSAHKLKAAFKKTGPLFRAAKTIRNAVIVRPLQFIRETMFWGRSLVLLCELDMIIVCGGGQLLDWGGPWAFPYTLFKWFLLAKCAGVKCIFLNSGAGPLDTPLSRWFVKRTLSMADYISLRDQASGELLRKIGFRGKFNVAADVVWSLRLPDGLVTKRSKPREEMVIGIAPMAYGDSSRHWVDDDSGYQRLIDSMAEFSGRMLQRGHRIKLFSSDIWFDSQALDDLEAAIRSNCPATAPGQITREAISGTDDLATALSGVDCYVTCRFHGVIFASLLNVPTLALAPHPKITTLMKDMDVEEYCVDITRCDAEWLTARFDQLTANMDDVKARVRRRVEQYQSLLASQFDALFRPSTQDQTENEDSTSIRSVR